MLLLFRGAAVACCPLLLLRCRLAEHVTGRVNSTHLIGIGKDATLQGRVQGLKLALFDASTPSAPIESYTLSLGDRQTHSAALDDHKAFVSRWPSRPCSSWKREPRRSH